jgi:hypothetical protein
VKLHPRTSIVKEAELKIGNCLLDISIKYNLTYGELTRILARELDDIGRYTIRLERHPNNPDKKGDEE